MVEDNDLPPPGRAHWDLFVDGEENVRFMAARAGWHVDVDLGPEQEALERLQQFLIERDFGERTSHPKVK
jgi:hypothetical protein